MYIYIHSHQSNKGKKGKDYKEKLNTINFKTLFRITWK